MSFLLILTQSIDFPAIFAIFCNLPGMRVAMISGAAEAAKKITDKTGSPQIEGFVKMKPGIGTLFKHH
jgi:hypothetical protein